MHQYFSQAKGRAGGIRFDNASLWSRIENRVGVWFAAVCADKNQSENLLTVTRSSLRRFTLLLPREVCQNSWYERKNHVDYRSQLRSGKSAGRRGTTSGLAGGGHAPERSGPSEFRGD